MIVSKYEINGYITFTFVTSQVLRLKCIFSYFFLQVTILSNYKRLKLHTKLQLKLNLKNQSEFFRILDGYHIDMQINLDTHTRTLTSNRTKTLALTRLTGVAIC